MPRSPYALLSALALGCGSGGSYFDEELSCAYDPHEWWDNAYHTLLQADDEGVFDFDPPGDAIARREGAYDFGNGDFGYVNTYAGSHPYLTVEGSGYGTIYASGDLDLVTKNVYQDVLGETWAEQVRTERVGCTGTTRVSELDVDAPADAEPDEFADSYTRTLTIASDEQVTWHMEREEEYGLYVYDASATPEIALQSSEDYADGGYVAETTWGYDGTGSSTWTQLGAAFGDDYDFAGTDTMYFDGSTLRDYDILTGGTTTVEAEVELLYLYDGSATGTYTVHQDGQTITCDVEITAGGESCTMECPGYGSYDC